MTPEKWKDGEYKRWMKAKEEAFRKADWDSAYEIKIHEREREERRLRDEHILALEQQARLREIIAEQRRQREKAIRECIEGYNQYTGLLEAQDLIEELKGDR